MAFARNTGEISWAGAEAGMGVGDDGTFIGIFESISGTDFLAGITISNNPMPLALGEVYYIAAAGLVITQTAAANETEGMAQRALMGRLSGTLYYAIHTGDPGTTGANESDLARIPVAGGAFTYSDT